ncbi:MAG: SRPBCC family protein [Oceanihabitans sp.]|nr:SRPBCC family protein [Oceanihabitans sp.]
MKFTCTIDINAPRDKVVSAFLDPNKQQHFQDGFIRKEFLSGKINEVDAKSKLIYKKLELIETIQLNSLPDAFKGLYEHKHTTNTMHVTFIALNPETTRYISEIDYIKLNGFLIKMMMKLFPGMFRKQVDKWMRQFKIYIENE